MPSFPVLPMSTDLSIASSAGVVDDFCSDAKSTEFRYLLSYLRIYATWYEVFAYVIDTGRSAPVKNNPSRRLDALDVAQIDADHRVVREEWEAALEEVQSLQDRNMAMQAQNEEVARMQEHLLHQQKLSQKAGPGVAYSR